MTEDQTALAVAEQDEALAPPAEIIPPAPSVESMLKLAIERGVPPEVLERLVALHERILAQRAERAFNEAMTAFKGKVPAILKNRDATREVTQTDERTGQRTQATEVLYRYADLAEITRVIDPILQQHGLSYKWDSEIEADRLVVTCIVKHVAGHRESSKFACKGSGTKLMNAAQIAASATTFARRYSLVLALGLVIDEDDDGRRAAPMPQPGPDPSQPRVAPRAERTTDPIPGVDPDVAAGLRALGAAWKRKHPDKATGLGAWASAFLKTDLDMSNPQNWSLDAIEKCKQELE